MKSGLLWWDNSPKPLAEKINDAAARYEQKFGIKPDTCFVNPKDLPNVTAVEGIQIKTKMTIQPNHVWLGVSE